MSSPSPACLVKVAAGSFVSTDGGVNAASGDAIVIKLASQAGVGSWFIECRTTDDEGDHIAVTSSFTIDPLNKTASFTLPAGIGRAYRFFSQVNQGNSVDGVAQPSYATTFEIFVLTTAGRRVIALDETLESGPFGYIVPIDDLLRNPNPGSGEANTNTNAGLGADIAKPKSGVDTPLRSLLGTKSTTVTQGTNEITIDADGVATLTNAGTGNLSSQPTVDGGGLPTSRIVFGGAAPVLRSLTGGIDKRRPLVLIASGGPLVITNEFTSDAAATRIVTGTGGDVTIPVGAATILDYDFAGLRWRVLSSSAGQVVIFNDATPSNKSSITTTRIKASAMDNTKLGITNLGSDSTSSETGATGAYCTIAGDRCSAGGTHALCIGHFSVASGLDSIALGDTNVANNTNATAIGTNNVASGAQSTAIGNANLASGQGAVAIGNACSAAGQQSCAMGGACVVAAAAQYGHAVGFQNQVYASYGHALGTATQCWGGASNTFGEDTITTANRGLAANEYCEAHGLGANAFGGSTKANGDWSTAQGSSSIAARAGQRSLASGNFSNNVSSVGTAQAQTSELVFRGRTPGASVGESVALAFGEQGSSGFSCLNARGYTFVITATVTGILSGGARKISTIRYLVTVRANAGTATVTSTNLEINTGTADSVGSWDLSFGVSGLALGISFTTGTTQAKCAVVARVEFTESIYFLAAPTEFDGCSLWLVSDAGVSTVGGNVSAWADQSGNGRNFAQATAGNRPALVSSVVHGRPALRFNGTTQSLILGSGTLANLITNSDWTLFVVATWDPAAATGVFATPAALPGVISDTNGYWGLAQQSATQTEAFISDGAGVFKQASGTIESAQSISAVWQRSSYSAPIVEALRYEQGGQHCSIQQCGNVRALTGGVIIGTNFDGTLPFKGDVFEVIGFNRSVADEERGHIYQYLKDGWQ